jgi:hypothetical protein
VAKFYPCPFCHEFATETLSIFTNFDDAGKNKKTCKCKNSQVLKAFQDILVVFRNFGYVP